MRGCQRLSSAGRLAILRVMSDTAPPPLTRDTLRARLDDSAGYIHSLEACVEDESYLPGTPCPQCETGRLIHWPIWT